MRLPPFEYLTPDSLEKACSQLSQYKGEAKIVAGGSDLLVRMRQKLIRPPKLISLRRISQLSYIRHGSEGLRIGALTTLHDIEASKLVREKYPVISKTAGKVASYQIRSLCTIGGNICLDTRCWYFNQSHWWRRSRSPCYKTGGDCCYVVKGGDRCYALFSADMAPLLIAMDARIRVARPFQDRVIPLHDLYSGTGDLHIVLEPDEIISEIDIPHQPPDSGIQYVKFSLSKEVDFPVVGVAVSLAVNDGDCFNARIVISGVASGPVKATQAAEKIQGREGKDWSIPPVVEAAAKEIGPIVHIGVTPDYRRQMVKVITEQAIKEAIATTHAANRG